MAEQAIVPISSINILVKPPPPPYPPPPPSQPRQFVSTPDIAVSCIAFHPNQAKPYFAVSCGTIVKLYQYSVTNPKEPEDYVCVATLDKHEPGKSIYSVAFNYDGSFLATASSDKTVNLWEFKEEQINPTFVATLRGHSEWVRCVAFHPRNRNILLSSSKDRTVKMWKIFPKIPPSPPPPLLENPSPPLLLENPDERPVEFENPDERPVECVATLYDHTEPVSSIAFHRKFPYLATGSNDHTVILWNVANSESEPISVTTLSDHREWISSVAFHPEELLLATASYDYTARLYRFSQESPLNLIPTHTASLQVSNTHAVYSLAFHPVLPYLVTGSGNKTAKVWNFTNMSDVKCEATLEGHSSGVLAVAFNMNSFGTLATGDRDGTVKLWQTSDILRLAHSAQQYMFGNELGSFGERRKSGAISDTFRTAGAGNASILWPPGTFKPGRWTTDLKKTLPFTIGHSKKGGMKKNGVRSRSRRSRSRRRHNHRRSRKQQGRR
jgi:WD40 repeat protein